MAAAQPPPAVARRYPTLRFLVGLYKAVGVLVLAGGVIVGIYQLVMIGRLSLLYGFMPMLITILPSAALGGLFWLIAEGVAVFIAIEENTRQIALNATRAAPAQPSAEVTPISIGRLLDQMVTGQVQTNQRLDGLIAALGDIQGSVGAGVQGVESIAESSKVTATMLYRQAGKQP